MAIDKSIEYIVVPKQVLLTFYNGPNKVSKDFLFTLYIDKDRPDKFCIGTIYGKIEDTNKYSHLDKRDTNSVSLYDIAGEHRILEYIYKYVSKFSRSSYNIPKHVSNVDGLSFTVVDNKGFKSKILRMKIW